MDVFRNSNEPFPFSKLYDNLPFFKPNVSSEGQGRYDMSKFAARILIIGFLMFLSFPAWGLGLQEELEEETAQFTGRVLDLEKNPIAQAGLRLKSLGTGKTLSGSTSKKGEFAFRLLSPGKFSLTVVKEGYQSISKEIDLQAGTAPKVEISLAREPSEEQKKRKEALALFQSGMSLAQADKLDEALAAFRGAAELKPDFAEAHINLGLLLLRQGKTDEAESALQKALELKPDEARAKEALANIYFDKAKDLLQLDKFDEALEKLKRSSELVPDNPFTCYLLGYGYTQKGMKAEAIASFEAFLRLKPDAPQAPKVKEILENLKK